LFPEERILHRTSLKMKQALPESHPLRPAVRSRRAPTPTTAPQCFLRREHIGGIVRKRSVGPILLTEIVHPPAYQLPIHSHRKACFTLVLSGSF